MANTDARFDRIVTAVLRAVEGFGLVLILIGTVFAIGLQAREVVLAGTVGVKDILLMFIYLEIITMVGLYFSSGKLPLRYTLYIAMVAIARYIILGMKEMGGWTIVALTCSILVLGLTTLALRYADTKLPGDHL
ncbi:MAG: phosphate-starvation-inducible PsiE family protein [Pseudomonadota bacterium]|nr:phosphate-starvation-inducible PsiE family protein [Pseudomonadota bacterium]